MIFKGKNKKAEDEKSPALKLFDDHWPEKGSPSRTGS
jgi:hypothetical protein